MLAGPFTQVNVQDRGLSAMRTWKLAAAGAGRATRELTIPALSAGRAFADLGRASLEAVADIDGERLEALGRLSGGIRTYGDVAQMLEEERPDVLLINSPVAAHYEHAMLAIGRGVHFLIEKPATETSAQLREVRAAAEAAGVKGAVVHNLKFLHGFQKAWKWHQEGRLGKILHIDRVFMTPPHADRMEMDPGGWWHRLPGGRLADSLPHHLYVAYPFVGEMRLEHVSARKLSADRPWSRCDEAEISLRAKESYVHVRLSTNQESLPAGKASITFLMMLYGTRLNAAVFHPDAYPLIYPRALRTFPTLLNELGEVLRERVELLARRPRERGLGGGHNVFIARFLKYLEGEGPSPTPWDEAIHTMELSEQIGSAMEDSLRSRQSEF